MLLVHGNFAGKSWWRELLGAPPPGTHLISPDLPGFGGSPGGRGFTPSIPRYARSLSRFLDHLGLERAVLVGHSFGAAVAVELALMAPERFPAMFLLSPPPLDGLHTPAHLHPLLESYRHDRRGLRHALESVMRTRIPPYLDDLVDEARRMHPAGFTGNARVLSGWSVDGTLRRYTHPVLVASGDRDALLSPTSARNIARAFPVGAYTLLKDVGHSPQIEAPERVRELLSILFDKTGLTKEKGGESLPRPKT